MLKKGRESMRADTFLKLPIETVDGETLAPTYPYGVSGQGYLSCMWCARMIKKLFQTGGFQKTPVFQWG
jgi:hypothetical protein